MGFESYLKGFIYLYVCDRPSDAFQKPQKKTNLIIQFTWHKKLNTMPHEVYKKVAPSENELKQVSSENILRKYSEIMDFVRPDQPSKCTWHVGADQKNNPHTKVPL